MGADVKAKRTLNDVDEALARLRKDLREQEQELAQIGERRHEKAFAAAEGDQGALDELREIDEREQLLSRSTKNLRAAIDQAEIIRRPLAEEARTRDHKDCRIKAREIIERRLIPVSAEVDAAFRVADDALERRSKIIEELSAVPVSLDPVANKSWRVFAQSRAADMSPITTAAASTRLQPFIQQALPRLATDNQISLAEQDRKTFRLPSCRTDYED